MSVPSNRLSPFGESNSQKREIWLNDVSENVDHVEARIVGFDGEVLSEYIRKGSKNFTLLLDAEAFHEGKKLQLIFSRFQDKKLHPLNSVQYTCSQALRLFSQDG